MMGFLTVNLFPNSHSGRREPRLYWSRYIERTFAGSWADGYTQTITPLTPY